MSSMYLNLLGLFGAHLNGHPIEKSGVKAQALLIYLAVEQCPQRREHLLTLLWPGMPERSARHNLSQTIYALRRVFPEDTEPPLLLVDRQTVQLNPTATILVDLHQFDRLLSTTQTHNHHNLADCPTCIEALEQVIGLYQGVFISDFYLEDSNQFDEWAESVRENYRRKLLEALSTRSEIAIQVGDYEKALNCIDRQLTTDNLNERAHRQKMEVLALADRRVEAMRQYREVSQLLAEQLGVAPSQETTALYERIRSEDLTVSIPSPVAPTAFQKATIPRHNLVPQPTPFIGREQELAQLDEMLQDPHIRLISIVAPGGMGKTRLAIAAAERQLAMADNGDESVFTDGVYFVPLAPLSAPDQIPIAIANALNLPMDAGSGYGRSPRDTESTIDKLTAYLRGKQILLVLDNFEHLLDEVELLAQLLQAAPFPKILVTTRERLHLQEEQIFPLAGLRFPDWEAPQEPHGFTAIELFLQSTRRARPDFDLNPGDMTNLTRICGLVGGMPLALELAAGWVDLLSPAEIAAEIQSSLDFLASDLRNLPERHRSMRVVCDTTWARLTLAERRVFARISVFKGGFSRTAAQEVCGATLRDLANLSSKALIQYEPATERYRIHELLRQYGTEKLADNPDDEEITRENHSSYYCDQLHQNAQLIAQGKQSIAFERMEADFPNFQIGWDWAIRQSNLEKIDKAIESLCTYFVYFQDAYQVMELCQSVIDILTQQRIAFSSDTHFTDEMSFSLRLYAKASGWCGSVSYIFDQSKTAKQLAQSLAIVDNLTEKGIDTRYERAVIYNAQGLLHSYMANWQAAAERFQKSLSHSQEIEHLQLTLINLMFLGDMSCRMGVLHEAQTWYQQCLVESNVEKNYLHESIALNKLGGVKRGLLEYDEAKTLFEQSLELAYLSQDQVQVIESLGSLGHIALFWGKFDEAIRRLRECINLATAQRKPNLDHTFRLSCGVVEWLTGDMVNARDTFEKIISNEQQYSQFQNVATHIMFAEYLVLVGDYHQAERHLEITKESFYFKEAYLNIFVGGRLSRALGWEALVRKIYPEARVHLQKSVECYKNAADDEATAWSQAGLAWAEITLDNWKGARLHLQEALTTAIEIQGYIPMVFTLPVALLILSREDPELAAHVYQRVRSDAFMSKAQLFYDLVYKHLPDEIITLPFEVVEHSPEHRESLWATARLVLEKWTQEQIE